MGLKWVGLGGMGASFYWGAVAGVGVVGAGGSAVGEVASRAALAAACFRKAERLMALSQHCLSSDLLVLEEAVDVGLESPEGVATLG